MKTKPNAPGRRSRNGTTEAWNLAPLCQDCHRLVTDEDPGARVNLGLRLTDEEYAGLTEHAGEGTIERLFGAAVSR